MHICIYIFNFAVESHLKQSTKQTLFLEALARLASQLCRARKQPRKQGLLPSLQSACSNLFSFARAAVAPHHVTELHICLQKYFSAEAASKHNTCQDSVHMTGNSCSVYASLYTISWNERELKASWPLECFLHWESSTCPMALSFGRLGKVLLHTQAWATVSKYCFLVMT